MCEEDDIDKEGEIGGEDDASNNDDIVEEDAIGGEDETDLSEEDVGIDVAAVEVVEVVDTLDADVLEEIMTTAVLLVVDRIDTELDSRLLVVDEEETALLVVPKVEVEVGVEAFEDEVGPVVKVDVDEAAADVVAEDVVAELVAKSELTEDAETLKPAPTPPPESDADAVLKALLDCVTVGLL